MTQDDKALVAELRGAPHCTCAFPWPDDDVSLSDHAADRIEALEAEVAKWKTEAIQEHSLSDAMNRMNRNLRAQVQRMREALEPFAKEADVWEDGDCEGNRFDDTETLLLFKGSNLSVGDLRKARAALASVSPADDVERRTAERWLPIETADTSIAVVMQLAPDVPTMLHSYPVWVRTEGGEPREASWCQRKPDNPAGYWWDWDAEDVISPDEWCPHPLDRAALSEEAK